jgi:hypothetical protein
MAEVSVVFDWPYLPWEVMFVRGTEDSRTRTMLVRAESLVMPDWKCNRLWTGSASHATAALHV